MQVAKSTAVRERTQPAKFCFTARLYRFYVKLTMPVAKLACDAQEPKDQAVLARQLPVQELIPLLATKGLRQAPGGLVQ